jgi:hypothetical protein
MTAAPDAVEAIADRLAALRDRIHAAGGREVDVIAVTKGFPAAMVAAAIEAGCQRIGESYVQEWAAKSAELRSLGIIDRPACHFIGQLQTNKVRSIVGLVDVVESVDRASLIDALGRRMPGTHVLIQVSPDSPAPSSTGKAGCSWDDIEELIGRATSASLVVDGLMCVGPTEGGPQAARKSFRRLRHRVDELGLRVCSMGMSDDLDVAVGEGSTRVRVGSALFGARPVRR